MVWRTFDSILTLITGRISEEEHVASRGEPGRAITHDLLTALREAGDRPDKPDHIAVGWSHNQRSPSAPAQVLALEQRRAALGAALGVFYY
jgi:hypothetical protein